MYIFFFFYVQSDDENGEEAEVIYNFTVLFQLPLAFRFFQELKAFDGILMRA